jgi:hypothetical protein
VVNRQTVVGKGSAEVKVYKGKSVFEGIAIGKILLIKIKKRNIVCIHVEDVLTDKTGVLAFRGIPDKIYIAK